MSGFVRADTLAQHPSDDAMAVPIVVVCGRAVAREAVGGLPMVPAVSCFLQWDEGGCRQNGRITEKILGYSGVCFYHTDINARKTLLGNPVEGRGGIKPDWGQSIP